LNILSRYLVLCGVKRREEKKAKYVMRKREKNDERRQDKEHQALQMKDFADNINSGNRTPIPRAITC